VDDRIALIGDLHERDAALRIDCRGLVVSPGFLDSCSHSDEAWFTLPAAQSKTSQGVTTEIAGMCGRSAAPLGKQECASVDTFLHALRGTMGANSTIYAGLSGLAAAESEATVRAACEQGAAGVSLRLDGAGFDRDLALRSLIAARESGSPRCAVHLPRETNDVRDALEIAIGLAEQADVALHISHHFVASERDRGVMNRTLEVMERARDRGVALTCDVYPYVAAWIDLDELLPNKITREALSDPQVASVAALALQARYSDDWPEIILAEVGSEEWMDWCGTPIDELARAWRLPPASAVLRLIQHEPNAKAFYFCADEDDVAASLSASFTSIGTDASVLPVDAQAFFGQPHPRAFGTFPRVFGRFVRQRGTLTLEEAVRRMTSLPAAAFGIEDRGTIREGAFADLVVFNQHTIRDTATYANAVSLSTGIEYVFVNGVRVIDKRQSTSARPGRALRGGR
jgi:N-acyl-D-amino-acid deacylase